MHSIEEQDDGLPLRVYDARFGLSPLDVSYRSRCDPLGHPIPDEAWTELRDNAQVIV